MLSERDYIQRDFFLNRLKKRDKHLKTWARRIETDCYRVYDRDIPEIPLALDRYADTAVLYLYERPYEKDPAEETAWLALMQDVAAEALGIEPGFVFSRTRRRLGLEEQYERSGGRGVTRIVREQGLKFLVNLSDYLDTGLFMDHRPGRAMVRARSSGKRILNLYCYTGSFSVYALAGGAATVTGVDLSNTYLSWAQENIRLNDLSTERYTGLREDTQAFLSRAARAGFRYDLIILDPPTFSNSKKMDAFLDINRHWPDLIRACSEVLAPDGFILFSTNARKLRFDPSMVPAMHFQDIGDTSVPQDFRPRYHRAWMVTG
ncbi:MAG: rRNA (guanine-N2)-methyltransferase [Spirochaetales bacterium]|nr:MAG: rRNA (guanine-N2)-methyltransferase [Spirochaetales bacterium]